MNTKTRYFGSKLRLQGGITLVELMVAMVIALLIAAAVGSLYVSTKETNRLQDGTNYARESALAVGEQMAREIRKAGNYGCWRWKPDVTPGFTNMARLPDALNGDFPIPSDVGPPVAARLGPQYDINGGAATVTSIGLPTSTTLVPVVGSDFVSIAYGQPEAFLTEDTEDAYKPLVLGKKIAVKSGQPLLVTSCDQLTLLRSDSNGSVTTIAHDPGSGDNIPIAAPELQPFKKGSQLMSLAKATFFLATDIDGVTGLYQWDTGTSTPSKSIKPFAANVVNMKVLYAVESGGSFIWSDGATVTANAAWGKVQAAQIHYVVASSERSTDTAPKAYVWNVSKKLFEPGVTAAPGNRPQQTFSVTTALFGRVQVKD
jgi:type IV pilus assembly protein PilW